MLDGLELIPVEVAAIETARKLCAIDLEKLSQVIRFRREGRLITGIAPAADLVSEKSVVSLQILVFAISELRKTLPTTEELRAGSADMLRVMEIALGEEISSPRMDTDETRISAGGNS